MHSRLATIFLAAFITTGLTNQTSAQAMRTGQSVALAGSGACAMYGSQVVGWNPANLGLKANPAFSLTILSFSTSIGNNAFSPKYIGDTFVKGDTLSDATKQDILGKMSTSRLKLYGLFGLPLFGLSINNYSFNIDAHMLATASLPSSLFELMLTGPVKNTVYDLANVEESSLAYWSASVSASQSLPPPPFMKELAVGASFKYLGGVAYAELDHKEGSLQVTDEVIHANGFFRVLSSTKGGDGVALDLAAAGRLEPVEMYVGATLGNVLGEITWTGVQAKEVLFSRNEGLNADSLTKKDYWKNFLYKSDTTFAYSPTTSALPRYLLLSADRPYLNGDGDLFLSYYQGFNNVPGQTTSPRISVGSEFRWIPVLPLRAGVAFGGVEGSEFSAGFGLNLIGYRLNFGASWQQGVLAGARGFSFAVTNTFGAGFKRGEM